MRMNRSIKALRPKLGGRENSWKIDEYFPEMTEEYKKKIRISEVNKQDFLQVFQGSGIGKIEDKVRG